jgi:general secretion pathway protein K
MAPGSTAIPKKPAPTAQGGVALVLVLWVVSLMTLMAGSFALSTQREAGLIANARARSQAIALADAGIHYAMLMLSLPDLKKRWQADGRSYAIRLAGAEVRIRLVDEAGKVDLNGAQELTLRTILSAVTGNEDQAVQLADAILDWRDADDFKHLHGAEAAEYRAAGLRQAPQNRNFLVFEELREVLGMTPQLYRKLEPFFTLYTAQDGINPAKASRDILLALAGGNEAMVDAYLAQRQIGLAPPPPLVQGIRFHGAADTVFTVYARAVLPDQQAGFGVKAVIRRDRGIDGSPFAFLSWKPQAAESAAGE